MTLTQLFICLTLFFAFLINCDAVPTIINSLSDHCDYEYEIQEKNKTIHKKFTISNQVFHTVSRNYEITYTLCGKLPPNRNVCGGQFLNGKICLRDKKTKTPINVGSSFTVIQKDEKDEIVLKSNGPNCVKIFFVCDNTIKDTPKLRSGEDDCDYEITMRHPKCQPPCTVLVHDRLIDLSKMRTSYLAKSNKTGREYYFTICGSDPHCDDDINACEMTNQNPISLSETKSQHLVYTIYEDTHKLLVRGSFKIGKNMKRLFELNLKCNWDVEAANPVYSDVQIQGKNYKFEMESSFGCIKTPTSCSVIDKFYFYDLKNLNQGKWIINIPDGRIFINVCRNLDLPPNNRCSNSSSQVCKITSNGEYINYGSIFTNFEVVNDQVQVQIIDGQKCKENPLETYRTKINFECSKNEEKPKFLSYDNCVMTLLWKTPKACPSQDKNLCSYISTNINNNYNYTINGTVYNFNVLRKVSQNYIVRYDQNNERIEYHINIGQPVFLEEAPCIKNAMILMKDYNEPHLKDRIVSLGQFVGFDIINGKLAIQTLGGHLCDTIDYKAIIYFECSMEEKLTLLKRTKCEHEFTWKTRQACSTIKAPLQRQRKCNYFDDNKNKFDLYTFGKNSFKLDLNSSLQVIVNVCDDFYKICAKDICKSLPLVTKTFSVNKNTPTMNFEFQHNCDSNLIFNRTEIQFVCDLYKNDYVTTLDNCTLNLLYKTNAFCNIFKNNEIIKTISENPSHNKFEHVISTSNDVVENEIDKPSKMAFQNNNCSLTNHKTGIQYNIPNFVPYHVPVSYKCPDSIWNITKKSILLKYNTDEICKSPEEKYSYDITLLCQSIKHHQSSKLELVKNENCKEFLYYEDEEVCNIFHELLVDALPVVPSTKARDIGISVFVVICIIAIVTLTVIYRARCVSFYRRHVLYRRMYPKDASI